MSDSTKTTSPSNDTSNEKDDEMPEYLEHYYAHNDRDYYDHIQTLHEAAGTAGTASPSDAPDILEDLLHLQATKQDWHPVWTIGMAMTNFGAGELVFVPLSPVVLVGG